MVKFKTNIEKEVRDERGKVIGQFIIRMIVNDVLMSINGFLAKVFYYYELEDGNQVTLCAFKTNIPWILLRDVEPTLPPFPNNQYLEDALIPRVVQFTFIQQQMESGENFGTVYTDWEVDEIYQTEVREAQKKGR